MSECENAGSSDVLTNEANLKARVEALGRGSHVAAVTSAIGLTILLGSLFVAGWRLKHAEATVNAAEVHAANAQRDVLEKRGQVASLENELSQKRAQLDSLAREVDGKTRELEQKANQVSRIKTLVSKSRDVVLLRQVENVTARAARGESVRASFGPVEGASKVILAVRPTEKMAGDQPLYDIRFSTQVPDDKLEEILKVEYFFDHPTFVPRVKTSFDAANDFAIKYFGWGCLNRVKITLVSRNGSRRELPVFDMCASEDWRDRDQPPR